MLISIALYQCIGKIWRYIPGRIPCVPGNVSNFSSRNIQKWLARQPYTQTNNKSAEFWWILSHAVLYDIKWRMHAWTETKQWYDMSSTKQSNVMPYVSFINVTFTRENRITFLLLLCPWKPKATISASVHILHGEWLSTSRYYFWLFLGYSVGGNYHIRRRQ
jgi:hypothetical protein